jgi:carbon-monoxide dehydrogenase large subunit
VATLLVGSHSHGQGHETTYRQLAAEFLGLAPADVRVVCGDTSRTMMAGGAAFKVAAAKIVEQGRRIAAHALEAPAEDVRFDDGRSVIVGTDRAISLRDVARMSFVPWSLSADIETGLHAAGSSSAGGISFPNGCHVCEVEIDPQTGEVRILSYLVVEDVGTVVNPLLLKGQVQGGVVQGLGQALMEQVVYDAQSGQLLTGSFMDYAMPRADVLPGIEVLSHPVPTSANPLGAKGAGEAGTVGALAAAMNAIGDALWAGGVAHFDMPATPCRVWEALVSARRDACAADRIAG